MPQTHFPQPPADEPKSANFKGSRPFAAFVKNRLGISVVVMKASKNGGAPTDESPVQLDKYLPGS